MRRGPIAKLGVAFVLMLVLNACADTSRHLSADPEKVTRTTAIVSSSTSSTTQPPPTTTPQPPTSRTATLSVSTEALEAGQPITVNGNDCPAGYWASANLLPSTPSAYPAIFSTPFATGGAAIETSLASNGLTRVTSGSNATWTISTAVPMVVPGASLITAQCVPPDSTTASGFIYRPKAVSVSTPYTLSVAPGTTVAPGSTLTVRSEGGGCGQIALPFVALYEMAGTTQTVVYSWAQSSSATDWRASLVVPSGLADGRYRLEADCDYSRGAIYGSYASLAITIE